jgi:hypothetical protein
MVARDAGLFAGGNGSVKESTSRAPVADELVE